MLSDDCKRTANVIADTIATTPSATTPTTPVAASDTTTVTMMLHKLSFDQFVQGETRDLMAQNALHKASTNRIAQDSASSSSSTSTTTTKKDPNRNNADTFDSIKLFQNSYSFINAHTFNALHGPMTRRLLKQFLAHVRFGATEFVYQPKLLPQKGTAATPHTTTAAHHGTDHPTNPTPLASTTTTPRLIEAMTPTDTLQTRNELAQLLRTTLQTKKGQRSDAEVCFLMQVFQHTTLFVKYCPQWNVQQIREFVQHGLHYDTFQRNKPLFQIGRPATTAYMVMSGLCEMVSNRQLTTHKRRGSGGGGGGSGDSGQDSHNSGGDRHLIGAGDIVGELALQGVGNRLHTSHAKVHSQTVVIDIPMYMRIAQNNRNFKLKYALLRNNTALLKDWPNDRLFRLAFHFQEKIYTGKRLIVTDVGDIPPGVHIVMEGSVGVSGTFQWQVVWQFNSSPCIDDILY